MKTDYKIEVLVRPEILIRSEEKRFIGMFKFEGSNWCMALPVQTMYLQTMEGVLLDIEKQKEDHDRREWKCEYKIAEIKGTLGTEQNEVREEEFLGMKIKNSGNSDGVTLVINGCSYGNFGKDWETARVWALRWFMILRPKTFGHGLAYRLNGQGGSYLEFGLLEDVVKKEGLTMPEGVKPSNCGSRLITYNFKKV